MSMSIEEAFAAICEKHDLRAISITFHPKISEGARWDCYVHWDMASGNECAGRSGGDAQSAISAALAEAAVRRADAITVPPIEIAA